MMLIWTKDGCKWSLKTLHTLHDHESVHAPARQIHHKNTLNGERRFIKRERDA